KNCHDEGDRDWEWDFIAYQVFLQQCSALRAQLKHELDVVPYPQEEQEIPEQNQRRAKPAWRGRGQCMTHEDGFTHIPKELKDGEPKAQQRERSTDDGHQGSVRAHSRAMKRKCRSRRGKAKRLSFVVG